MSVGVGVGATAGRGVAVAVGNAQGGVAAFSGAAPQVRLTVKTTGPPATLSPGTARSWREGEVSRPATRVGAPMGGSILDPVGPEGGSRG